jgi:hypothetical protein
MFSRPALLTPCILIISLTVGYPIFWFYAALTGEDLINTWIEKRRLQGLEVSHEKISSSGFPFLVRVTLKSPEVRSSTNRLIFTSQSASLEYKPWDFKTLRIEAIGVEKMGDFSQNVALKTASIESVLTFGSGERLIATSIVANGIRIVDTYRGVLLKTKKLYTDIEFPDRLPITYKESAFRLKAFLKDIVLPKLEVPLFGTTIQSIRVKADFLGPVMIDEFPKNLRAWRKAGGTLELSWLRLVWNTLDMRANGTLALDQEMRPIGALTADIRGFDEALSALANAGLIRQKMLPASRVTLNLLAKTDENDGRRVLTVPMTAQNGAFFVGPIKLTKLPAIVANPH